MWKARIFHRTSNARHSERVKHESASLRRLAALEECTTDFGEVIQFAMLRWNSLGLEGFLVSRHVNLRQMKRRSIEQYEILRKLGAGGSGVVYLANDTLLQRPVVLKILRT